MTDHFDGTHVSVAVAVVVVVVVGLCTVFL